jgi:fatty acid desaturase
MSSLTRSIARKPQKPTAKRAPSAAVAPMTEAERKALKARFFRVMAVTIACCFAAFAGMVGNVSLHQWWGLPLFVLAMVGGFGAQILFILGLVKANRTDKGA